MFKVEVFSIDQKKVVGELDLPSEIFGVPVRKDILYRVVSWQLARAHSGTHKTKQIGDVSGTTKKPWRQKGTGRARLGSLRAPQCRGGGIIFGPVVRDRAFNLQKKVRRMGLKCALSARLADGRLKIVDSLSMNSGKTKDVMRLFERSTLLVDGDRVCEKMQRAIANIHTLNILPKCGINVYDILKHDHLVLSVEAVKALQNWFELDREVLA